MTKITDKFSSKKKRKPQVPVEEQDRIGWGEEKSAPEAKITPEEYEPRLDLTHDYGGKIETTELAIPDYEHFNGRTKHERNLAYKDVKKAPLFEKPEEASERIEEKATLVIEEVVQHLSLVNKKIRELTTLIRKVIESPHSRKKDLLEKVQSQITELDLNLGLMLTYFDFGLKNIEDFRKVYPEDFEEMMMLMLNTYYTKTEKNKEGLDKHNDLTVVLQSDVLQVEESRKEVSELKVVVEDYIQKLRESEDEEVKPTSEQTEEASEKDTLQMVTEELREESEDEDFAKAA